MVEIYPKLTQAKLKKSARKTSEGKGTATLPGVKTDAKQAATANPSDPKSPFYGAIYCDPEGYGKNRELAERISKAVRDLKKNDANGPRFVLAWRLYPNDDHPCWHRKDVHFCGCGCGCFARGERQHPRKGTGAIKRSRRKRER
jgi:hypothetical protein